MDLIELKREQLKLSRKVNLRDSFSRVRTLGGIVCLQIGDKLIASVVVCEFPSMNLREKKTYLLDNPLPYKPEFQAYREMPAMIEAFNLLEEEPDVLLVKGPGVLHPRKLGIASHLGLALNVPTIGVQDKLSIGRVENGKIIIGNEIMGFEMKTKEYSNPLYVSPGHLISLGSVLNIISKTIMPPHKKPEPLHLANKIARKVVKDR